MKKIQKKISLEQFKSRMPGIIDSYIDYIISHNPDDFKYTAFVGTDIKYIKE